MKKWYSKDDPTVSLLCWLCREFFSKLCESTHAKQHWPFSGAVICTLEKGVGEMSNLHREHVDIYIWFHVYTLVYNIIYIHSYFFCMYIQLYVYIYIYIYIYMCVCVSSIPFSTGPKYFCRCPRFGSNDFIDLLTSSNVSFFRREVWFKWILKHPDLKGIVMISIVWPDTVCILLIVLRVVWVDSESSIQSQASLHVFFSKVYVNGRCKLVGCWMLAKFLY